MNGLGLSVSNGFRTLAAGEMVLATTELGFAISDARRYRRTDLVIIGMITIGVMACY